MSYEEDDLYDYSDSGFNEDEAIDEVISSLKPKIVVTEDQAEAELDKVDWDVDVAIANLRKRYAKPTPKSQSPAPQGKLTPLQMLAQRRNLAKESQNTDDKPKEQLVPKPSLAKLASLRLSKNNTTPNSPEERSSEVGLSALAKLRSRKTAPKPTITLKEPAVDNAEGEETPEIVKKWIPEIDYNIPHIGMSSPSLFGEIIGAPASTMNESRITNTIATAKTAKTTFSKPSPDDIVLNAQEKAFSKANDSATVKPAPSTPTPAKPKTKIAAVSKDDLITRLNALNLKPNCSFVVIGHVDAGKSTLMGRLLLDTGTLSKSVVSKFEHESQKAGKKSFWLAWALDATIEERERGVTVDVGEAQFETETAHFNVLDAPGHRDYVPNMIAGVAQADIAVLVVDSDTNAFEAGFSLDGQTKEHALLARSLGLTKIIVAVNKMDTQNWNEERYDEICAQTSEFLINKVGYTSENIKYVPTSGISGDNVVNNSGDEKSKWYSGPSLVGCLDSFAESRTQDSSYTQPFRFLVSNSYIEKYESDITVTGRVLTGCVEVGDPVELIGANETAKVKQINRDFLVAGSQGEIKLTLDNKQSEITIRPGDIVAGANNELRPVSKFIAKIQLFDSPRPILPGTKMSFHLGRIDEMVKVTKIIELLNGKKKAATSAKVRHLGKGSMAKVELELSNTAILSTSSVCKDLSRFILRMNGSTIGGGVVDSLEL